MPIRSIRCASIVGAVAICLAAAGCGGDSPSGAEQVLWGDQCEDHPDVVLSTYTESQSVITPERLGTMIRGAIQNKSSNYAYFDVNLSPEQQAQYEAGEALVEQNRTNKLHDAIKVNVINPGGWDGLNIDRSAGTFEGDICVSGGNAEDISY